MYNRGWQLHSIILLETHTGENENENKNIESFRMVRLAKIMLAETNF